ncbi:conserved protein of unknown function [Rhodovastum atsumiense]|uniref:Uncharacterized protein n=1 Tax=Rhodovastum atsumiense TaxID=504468 RepID=A0A5M6IM58_9PROT|nr:hypothetical protein [Rhodovastum atsumiense]KAA5609364.1 hypothetical protein F1189_24525 [Rhodovastum atsumiense]CAH2598576.1 conserved protein of unknown function [Rhodovastum atsumiense]
MPHDIARDWMLHWLDQHAFHPVLQLDAEAVPAMQRQELRALQHRVLIQADRFRQADSAGAVLTRFRHDLRSTRMREVERRLRALRLPTIGDLHLSFEDLAAGLGVESGGGGPASEQE